MYPIPYLTWLSRWPFTNNFSRADIHQMLSPDILHQLIKGTFKDHLITWVEDYIVLTYSKARAEEILADIHRRIAAAPSFSGLRRFPEGRRFKQWTGNNSKALMKVYIPAITGHVPDDMVQCIHAFLDFCYIARRNIHTKESLEDLEEALDHFHCYHEVFRMTGVHPTGFSLSRQHSLKHYKTLIEAFDAPNGLCFSITESSHYNALGQMLQTNQRADKLEATHVNFKACGMLEKTSLALHAASTEHGDMNQNAGQGIAAGQNEGAMPALKTTEDDGDVSRLTVYNYINLASTSRLPKRKYSKSAESLATELRQPRLLELIWRFLYDQLDPDSMIFSDQLLVTDCPVFEQKIYVYHSTAATFFTPSDPCGTGRMHREHIRATPSWYKGPPRYDCVFVNTNPNIDGMRGLEVARIRLFMAFKFRSIHYPCALVHWYERTADEPDDITGY
ncbi:hypothetical protein OBBRIDRAFT_813252 [Obba rivulosa]|uniref:Uncharacterized protein n=1 Tax=Obba rivulosa TaxID=1052685 RepID=A0A8E2AQV7_9APHY|nr:hypothetical protein OBBRIDRAFT_813252 [Obba rivulosa]